MGGGAVGGEGWGWTLVLLDHLLSRSLAFTGLALISLGTGGIKPCVSAFGGDQFKEEQVRAGTVVLPCGDTEGSAWCGGPGG